VRVSTSGSLTAQRSTMSLDVSDERFRRADVALSHARLRVFARRPVSARASDSHERARLRFQSSRLTAIGSACWEERRLNWRHPSESGCPRSMSRLSVRNPVADSLAAGQKLILISRLLQAADKYSRRRHRGARFLMKEILRSNPET